MKLLLVTMALLLFMVQSSVPAAPTNIRITLQTASYPVPVWPMTTPAAAGFNTAQFQSAMNAMPSPSLVIRAGAIVGSVGSISQARPVWSGSKSLSALIAGRLFHDGVITLDTLVPGSAVPTLPLASYRQFMSMTSDFHLSPHTPGLHWAYNNGGVHHYANQLRALYGNPSSAQLLRNAYGTAIGFQDGVSFSGFLSGWDGGWSISTRDMARVAYLVLRRGHWNGQQLLTEEFVDALALDQIPSEATMSPDNGDDFYNEEGFTDQEMGQCYSFGFWLPKRCPQKFGPSTTDTMLMWGARGTAVYIVPSHDLLVVAVNAGRRNTDISISPALVDQFVAAIIQ